MEQNIKLELNLEETNFILNALSELPFKVSNTLIAKISSQANSQIKETKK